MDPENKIAICQKKMIVPWGDCDPAGIVYYARYFDWFSNGRIELFRQIGVPYMDCFHKQGIFLVAIEAKCRYRRSLRPEEEIVLKTCLSKLTRSRMIFNYNIFKEDVLAVEGMTAHAYVDDRGKPFDLKKRFPLLWDKVLKALKL